MKRVYNLFIVDEKEFVEATKTIFRFNNEVKIVGCIYGLNGIVEHFSKEKTHILLININYLSDPAFVSLVHSIVNNKTIKVVVLTMSDNLEIHLNLFKSGIAGVVLKNQFVVQFNEALKAIANNEVYFPVLKTKKNYESGY